MLNSRWRVGLSEAYEFSYALYLARQVDREAAQMIVEAAEVGLIQIDEATDLLMELSRPHVRAIGLK